MSKTKVLYQDVAVGAAQDASVSTASAESGSDISMLPFGSEETNPIATLEVNRWLLNGKFKTPEERRRSFWSQDISDENGGFSNPPSIEISFDQQYSSVGLTLNFDTATSEFCSSVGIQWYQSEVLKSDKTFYPDSASYFCENTVEAFDKIVITINKTSLPYRRARIDRIVFGLLRAFDMTELQNVNITNEADLSSLSLPISQMDWTLNCATDVDFMFQLKQPVEVFNDDNLIGTYYIDESSRTSSRIYNIKCKDAFGVLDDSVFSGGIYDNKSAKSLITEILNDEFDVSFEIEDVLLTGILLQQSKREAFAQILFACGAVASTDGSRKIRVFNLPSNLYEIEKNRTYVGASTETSSIVTSVTVFAHTYTEDESGSIEVNGKKYKDTQTEYTVSNPNVIATDKKNEVKVTNATLVSEDIGQAIAQKLYDYYLRRNTHKSKFVWHGEKLGDKVAQFNAWGGTETGHIVKMEIKLSNTVAASTETKGI